MIDPQRVTELAEAVADGRSLDWSSVESSSTDPAERAVIAKLRIVHSIHGLMTTRTGRRAEEAGRTLLSAGDTWGALDVREHVGRGRFGDVYRAWDPALDREVALKLVRHGDREDGVETRVVEEGRLMARVRHPNVVTIHGAQRIAGVSGLWMEFVEGRTLSAELAQRGPFAADELTHVGVELARALEAVHRAGLVHRDVKAQNVMRDASGRIVLGDFGTGRELDEPEEARGGLAGTPAYLAPEIFARQPATPWSDLYSLGALLFHLATATYPVRGRSLRDLRDAHSRGERASLTSLRSDLPSSLTMAIETALDPDPTRRFESASAMRDALEQCRDQVGRSSRRWSTRVAVAVCLTVAAGLLGYATMRWNAPTVALPLSARDLVLVTAFDNRTDDPQLAGTLEFALERELNASSVMTVVPRTRVTDALALMRRPGDTVIDVDIGREVAVRDGEIRAVVAGRVERVGPSYALTVSVIKPADGSTALDVREASVGPDELLDAIGRVARTLRQRLGESLPAIQASAAALPKVTTSSLRALQLYRQARDMSGSEGGVGFPNPQAVGHLLQEALREDPDFVMAHILLAHALDAQSERRAEVPGRLALAVAAAERGTAVDRYVAVAERDALAARWVFGVERIRLRTQAAASYEALLRVDPEHEWSLACLTNIYPEIQRYADALRAAERLVALRPNSLTALWRAARASAAVGETEQAGRYAERARALDVAIDERNAHQAAWVRLFEAHESWLRNDIPGAIRIADRVEIEARSLEVPAQNAYAMELVEINLTLGRLGRAAALMPMLNTANRGFAMTRVASPTLTYGVEAPDREKLRGVLARYYPDVGHATNIISTLVIAGRLDWAREALAILGPAPNAPPGYLKLVRAEMALAERRPRDAVAELDRDVVQEAPRGSRMWALSVLTRANAHAALGDVERAIAVLAAASANRRDFSAESAHAWLALRARLADLSRSTSRDADAEAIETELSTLLAAADDDHPIKRRLAGAAGVRRASATALDNAHDWVLVAAFENRTGEAILDGTLEFALERGLADSTAVKVALGARVADVLQAMGRPGARLDIETSRQVARTDGGIGAIAMGRVDRVGQKYTVAVAVVSAASGAVIANVGEPPVPQWDLLPAIGRLAISVRERLGEDQQTATASRAALARATLPSLKAWQVFAETQRLLDAPDAVTKLPAAEQLLRTALRDDPGFASGHALLTEVILRQGNARLGEAVAAMKRAVALSDREPEVERLRIEGAVAAQVLTTTAAERRRWIEHGIDRNEAVLRLRPYDDRALLMATFLYEQLGRPSVALAARLSDMRPLAFAWAARASAAALSAGDLPTARRYVARGLAHARFTGGVDGRAAAWLNVFPASEAWLKGDVRAALAATDRVADELGSVPASGRSSVAMQLSNIYVTLGLMRQAEKLAAQVDGEDGKFTRVAVAYAREAPDRLWETFTREYPRLSDATHIVNVITASGRLAEAHTALELLKRRSFAPREYIANVEGQLALAEGRIPEAIEQLELNLGTRRLGTGHDAAIPLAQALAAGGDLSRAIQVLETFSTARSQLVARFDVVTNAHVWLRLRDRLAVLYRQAGRHRDADAVEAELSALLAVADEDHPIKRRLAATAATR